MVITRAEYRRTRCMWAVADGTHATAVESVQDLPPAPSRPFMPIYDFGAGLIEHSNNPLTAVIYISQSAVFGDISDIMTDLAGDYRLHLRHICRETATPAVRVQPFPTAGS